MLAELAGGWRELRARPWAGLIILGACLVAAGRDRAVRGARPGDRRARATARRRSSACSARCPRRGRSLAARCSPLRWRPRRRDARRRGCCSCPGRRLMLLAFAAGAPLWPASSPVALAAGVGLGLFMRVVGDGAGAVDPARGAVARQRVRLDGLARPAARRLPARRPDRRGGRACRRRCSVGAACWRSCVQRRRSRVGAALSRTRGRRTRGRGLGVEAARDAAGAGGRGGRPRPRAGSRVAIATGSSARLMAVAHRTASQPISSAMRRVGGGADAGVEDHRDAGLLDDQAQVVRVEDPLAGADRRAERHDRRAADVLQPARERSGRRSCTGGR